MATASKKSSASLAAAPKKPAAKKAAAKSSKPAIVLEAPSTKPSKPEAKAAAKPALKAVAKKVASKVEAKAVSKPAVKAKTPVAKQAKVAKAVADLAPLAPVAAKALPAKKKPASKPDAKPAEVLAQVEAKPVKTKSVPKPKAAAKVPAAKLEAPVKSFEAAKPAKPAKAARKAVVSPVSEVKPAAKAKPAVKSAAEAAVKNPSKGAAKKALEEASKRALKSSERVVAAEPAGEPVKKAKAVAAKSAVTPVAPVAPAAVAAPVKAQPAKPKPKGKPAAPVAGKSAAAPAPLAPAVKPAPAPVPVMPAAPARFTLQALEASVALGEYRVSDIEDTGQNWRVQVQGALAIDCRCDCAGFALSDRGSCEHIDFALAQLMSQPAKAEALRRGPQFDYSEVLLRFGARRQLRWRQGHGCPTVLAEAAQALTDESGRLRAEAPGALAHLLQVAAAAGYELRVEEGVWPLLAHKRDAGQRVLRLEQNYPQGLESPALRTLLKLPLPMYQLEAALFAVSAGRSLLADDLGLGLYAQALAASDLFMRHFGVERVLLLCGESAQSRWLAEAQTLSARSAQMVWGDAAARAEQLSQGPAQIKICASSALAQDLSQLQAFGPELIIVDEASRLDAQALAALKKLEAARAEQGFVLLLSSQILSAQPKVLLPLVELLDQQRSGPYARFLSYHARRDQAGQIQGFVGLDALDQTLERLMFSRSKAELLSTLPPALVQLRSVALNAAQQELQAQPLRELRRGVQRWERSDYVSDSEQLALARQVQSLRRLAISPALLAAASEASADAPKLAAVAAVSRELLGSAVQRLVVFCQWDDALSLLAARLQSQGFKLMQLSAKQGLAERQALARRWREDERVQLLLISDAAAAGLQLINEGSDASLGLINLELPWSEELLGRRLDAVSEESTRGLPLIQLQAQQGLEQAMLQAMDVLPELPLCSLDGDASLQLLQGEDLAAWMRALALLCSLLPE